MSLRSKIVEHGEVIGLNPAIEISRYVLYDGYVWYFSGPATSPSNCGGEKDFFAAAERGAIRFRPLQLAAQK